MASEFRIRRDFTAEYQGNGPHSPSCGRKSAAGEVQIGERKQRKHLRAILGDAAIAHLAIAELALQDTEHVLRFGAHFAEAAIARLLSLAELAPWLGLLLDRLQNARGFCRAPLLVARVALVAVAPRESLDRLCHGSRGCSEVSIGAQK
jgi:hypothetical protein